MVATYSSCIGDGIMILCDSEEWGKEAIVFSH
jgi:hypothetical protein